MCGIGVMEAGGELVPPVVDNCPSDISALQRHEDGLVVPHCPTGEHFMHLPQLDIVVTF